jgi:hypothetical protein
MVDDPSTFTDDYLDLDDIDPSTLQPLEDDEGRGMSAGVEAGDPEGIGPARTDLDPEQLDDQARDAARDLGLRDGAGHGPLALVGNYPSISAYGVDLSNYDAKAGLNYRALRSSGRSFAWVKIGEGTIYYNPSAASVIAGLRSVGFVVGGYWFNQPGNGATQARLMTSLPQTPKGKLDLVPVMDMEVSGLGPAFALAFSTQIHATLGCWAGSYSSRYYFQSTLRSGAGWEKPGSVRWIAAYNNRGAGIACDVWQNSSSTRPAGTNRATDTDIAYTPLAKMTIGGAGGGGGSTGSWKALTAKQITDHGGYKPGDAPVYGMPSMVTIRSTDSHGVVHHSCWDARVVPADRCPRMWNGSGSLPYRQDYLAGLWVDFLRDLFLVPAWPLASSDGEHYPWAYHFGLQKGAKWETKGYFNIAMMACVKEWARQHGIPATNDATKRGLCTPEFWASMLGQRRA